MGQLPLYNLPGPPRDAGFAHGRALGDLLAADFRRAYIERLQQAIGFDFSDLRVQAGVWLERLPTQHQEEIAGMGAGSGAGTLAVAEFLYADIARSARVASGPHPLVDPAAAASAEAPGRVPEGPMCSALLARVEEALWIGRNCDWLTPTLMRGTAAVAHAVPNRIPVLAVGIRGDIDIDTGINGEKLWLHLHTLHVRDDPPPDRTCISWLFWAREALETCADLDELERFIESTARDRGVFVIAGDGKTDEAAVFECSRAAHTRHDFDPSRPVCVTNHTLARDVDEPLGARRMTGGTIGRFRALRQGLRQRAPRRGPDDLVDMLAAPEVEMRTPRWLRTIYSAVVCPSTERIWFAAGDETGVPAASRGRWRTVTPPW